MCYIAETWKILSASFRNCYLWGVMEIKFYKSPKRAFKLILVLFSSSSLLFSVVTLDLPTRACIRSSVFVDLGTQLHYFIYSSGGHNS